MLNTVNYWAVFAAAVAYMVIGYLWYGPLFGARWRRLQGLSDEAMRSMPLSAGQAMGIGFVSALLMAFVLGQFAVLWGALTVGDAIALAFWVWLGFVVTTQAGSWLWEGKPFALLALNGAASLVSFVAMATILVLFQ
ncbi:MAG: DUF1761 domain-containing protein [Candidatus Yanofskybacteria bacterium]|nr:DUF1761 domain-containing protein [Candidatus Yanofskybacteria bacterium]